MNNNSPNPDSAQDNNPQTEASKTNETAEVIQLGPPRPQRVTPRCETVPVLWKPLRQWICWRYQWSEGKWAKIPLIAQRYAQEPVRPWGASSTRATTWRSWEEAKAAYEDSLSWSDPLDGVGFVFNGEAAKDGLTYVGFDWDLWLAMAQAQCMALNTYAEVSPSGNGVHAIVRAKPFGPAVKYISNEIKVEVYCSGRYFTVTGQTLEGAQATIEDRPREVEALLAEIAAMRGRPTRQKPRRRERPTRPACR
jgi:primase-polymerase (primpol)-like protein